MTTPASPLIAVQIVDCIATGLDPTLHELFAVAERMWTDGAADRSAFAWGALPPDSKDRLIALRRARAALGGSGNS